MNQAGESLTSALEWQESHAHGYQDQIEHIVMSILRDLSPVEEWRFIRTLWLFFEDLPYCIINPRVVHNIPDSMMEHPDFLSLLRESVLQIAKRQNLKEIIFSIEDSTTDMPMELKARLRGIIKSNQEIQDYLESEIAEMEKNRQGLSDIVKLYQTKKQS